MKVPVAVPVDSVSVNGVSVGAQYQLIQYQKISTSRSVPVIPKPVHFSIHNILLNTEKEFSKEIKLGFITY
jgi:hypothetical protein